MFMTAVGKEQKVRVKYMERTYKAKNGVVEKVRFAAPVSTRLRSSKTKRSTPRKQESNKNQAIHILGRVLNNNFSAGDLLLTLTYDEEAYDKMRKAALAELPQNAHRETRLNALMDAADKAAKRFLRRLKDNGMRGAKTVLVTADMDGTTGELVRVHHHLVIAGAGTALERTESGMLLKLPNGRTLADVWGQGSADWELLRAGSYSKLAGYLIRQVRHRANRKRYTCSRNMEPIEYAEREIAAIGQEIRVPAGSVVEERQKSMDCVAQYVRYIPPAKKEKRGGHKRGGGADGV